jgi:hypothetical protein
MILDTGFLVVFGTLIIVFIIGIAITHQQKTRKEYDERQKIALGKAASTAFKVCLAGNLIGALLLPDLPVDGSFLMVTVGIAGVTIYALLAIHANAYFGIREYWKMRTGVFIALGIVYLLSAVERLKEHSGKLSFSDDYLPLCAAFLVIGFYSLYKHLKPEQESEEK